MATTKIKWSGKVWNPVTFNITENGPTPVLHIEVLKKPHKWKKPSCILVNSMSDLFAGSEMSIWLVFEVMVEAEHHQFQVLTKRSERMAEMAPDLPWTDNIWMGVTVEKQKYLHRIDHLRQTPAATKFISFEPLLGPVSDFDPAGIDWVIVGGESGPGARPMEEEWVTEIRDKCVDAGVAFFFKQWGGHNKKAAGCLLDGRVWNEYPA